MSLTTMITFLDELNQNNSLSWMHEHTAERKQVFTFFHTFAEQLQEQVRGFDSAIPVMNPEKLSFRLNRDIRFSHDKSPYNPTLRAHIGPHGKPFIPVGYFIQLGPRNRDSFIGGGLFAAQFSEATALIQNYLLEHPQEFLAIIAAPDFKEYFSVRGEQLKRFPRGYEETGTAIDDYLKYKSWYLEYSLPLQLLLD
ncbi:DUF2461 domain-containing protein [Enterococcus sp. LJL128]